MDQHPVGPNPRGGRPPSWKIPMEWVIGSTSIDYTTRLYERRNT